MLDGAQLEMTRNVDQLRSIQTFEELIPFLEDDLDWPFPHGSQDYEFDDLTFEYTPEELGLEEEFAAKIKRIHQLRPLVGGQPWGIFFVEFENKKLPVVVLRRILSHLVLKQRKSANPADRARWNAGDLLFISAFAEEGTLQREIAFAHFHQDPGDQPTLRVLGWDGGDTPLKLEHVSQLLKQRLSWPRNPADHAAWRKQWAGAFRYKIGEQIRTADLLARELARVARNIRDAAMALMKVESDKGPLRRMHEAFRTALIHDLTQEGFADTYAQTITYGLLTAAISRTDRSAGADGTFVLAEDIHNMVPITNPFLKEMLESFLKVGGRGTSGQPGLDFDELGVQEVVELLRSSDIDLPAVLEDFGNRNPGEDPVIRFYEDFLKAYNKELKIKRGVFYTPQPVVSYIVRSVHELLQTEFGISDGLASTITWGEMAAQMLAAGKGFRIPDGTSPDSPFVVILDPATGTATFLVEVIDIIFRTLTKRWRAERLTSVEQRKEWNRYVPVHLLPRLFGYELMMAPYAIAHMKIGLKLHETGYAFGSDARVRVYLTNALESAQDFSNRFTFDVPALAHEAIAVNDVKAHQRFTVIIGNPPYAKNSSNRSQDAERLVAGYKRKVASEKNVQPLSDDYVKFLAYALEAFAYSDQALISMITNRSYLAGLLHRGMREDIAQSCSQIQILDLHGDTNVGENVPAGEANSNVFDIQQGVCISTFLRSVREATDSVYWRELWGTREAKYSELKTLSPAGRVPLQVSAPYWFFSPKDLGSQSEQVSWVPIDKLFGVAGMGIKSRRDSFLINRDLDALRAQFLRLAGDETDAVIRADLQVTDNPQWTLAGIRALVRDVGVEAGLMPIVYRPFDTRFIWYHPKAIERGDARWPVFRNTLPSELSLLTSRQSTNQHFTSAFISRGLSEMKTAENSRGSYAFPLNLVDNASLRGLQSSSSNLIREEFESTLSGRTPEELLSFIYAVLYSPGYRTRYEEALRIEFPRIPRNCSPKLATRLCDLGASLISLHLLEALCLESTTVKYIGPVEPLVERVTYGECKVAINGDGKTVFDAVPVEVWKFEIGGYQVCEKWLKDRKGCNLSKGDINHYCKTVECISRTLEIMDDIDSAIEEHGGWPAAFA
jgi:hypothetical protein